MTTICKHIINKTHYDDSEVLLSSPLLKMAIKINLVGKDSNITRPSLVNGTNGLYPFLVLNMTEEQVAYINKDDDALTQALYVTLQDITNLKKLINPYIPDIADGFMILLKRYANLNFDLFYVTSPLFLVIMKIIDSIKAFYRVSCNAMNTKTKALIIWIILLQRRKISTLTFLPKNVS